MNNNPFRQLLESYNGRNRRTNQTSQSSADDKSDSGPGGSQAQRAAQGAVQACAGGQAGQGTSVKVVTASSPDIWYYFIQNGQISAMPMHNQITRKSGKWAPPWMGGELGEPNNAKLWPRRVEAAKMKASDVIAGEIVAWRAWYWDKQRRKLRSIFVDYEWPYKGPAKGEPHNGYGIHAFKTLRRVRQEYAMCLQDLVVGRVALWGDVIEFEQGYVSEFARPLEIHHEEVAELYGL